MVFLRQNLFQKLLGRYGLFLPYFKVTSSLSSSVRLAEQQCFLYKLWRHSGYLHKYRCSFFLNGSYPGVIRNYQNMVVSVKHNLIYSLITIRLTTYFDPIGSSSGLHYEPIDVRKLRTSLGSQKCLQR